MDVSTTGLHTLFLDGLKDIYYAENQILKALPLMSEAAHTEGVAAAFEKHRIETQTQVERLDEIFQLLGESAQGQECPAIDGILAEGDEIIEDHGGTPAVDAGLVAGAQAVEHYEIARYGTLLAWAGVLGMTDAAELLQATLEEELATDETLTQLAEGGVNDAALADADEDDDASSEADEIEVERTSF